VRALAPSLVYERGSLALPVDPATCRSPRCADAPARAGPVRRSASGEAVTLFTHVARRGTAVYVQFWEYFPDSTWSRSALALGARRLAGYHLDDWESYQVRVGADGRAAARASAHHGYTGRRIGPDLNLDQVDPGLVPRRLRGGWTRPTGWLRIARGSHAGYVARGALGRRWTPAAALRLLPLETARLPETYAIVPPWRKRVYADPEWPGT
jgi:hypothetical protein